MSEKSGAFGLKEATPWRRATVGRRAIRWGLIVLMLGGLLSGVTTGEE